MRSFEATLALLLSAAPALANGGAPPHPFGPRDLLNMQRLSEPRPSPAGDRVVFAVRTLDPAADRYRADLWIVDGGGGGLRRLTAHEGNESGPVWSPDGESVYFLSPASGSAQVWRVPAAGGEPVQVTKLPLDVGAFLLSPDGRTLVVTLDVDTDCPTLACTVERSAERAARPAKGRLYDRLFVRHWDTWEDGLRSHPFALPVGGGEPVDLARGLDADVPAPPFGGTEELTFTPDGRAVVFAARVAPGTEPWSTDFDLYLSPVDGSRPPRNLTDDNPAWDTQPLVTPDGSTLVYLAMRRPGYESDRFDVTLRPLAGGAPRVVAAEWDRSPSEIALSRDGRTLYATALDTGRQSLFAIDLASGAVRKLVAGGTARAPGVAGDRIVFTLEHQRSPAELFSVRPDGGDLRQLTTFNAEELAGVALGEPEQFTFTGAGGDRVYAWVVKPPALPPGGKAPVAFIIHGGPQGSSSDNFHFRWNPQVYAGAGYAAVLVDFHGSTGYGQAFTDAIRGDWGGKPLEDLQKGLAAALARYPWMDGERVCALGASYGGYMVNWIAGRWPDRFRCLVSHDGTFDQRMFYYSTEELWHPEWEHGGPYFENPEGHEKHNPVLHVDRWQTPMLVIHGALDYRIPETHGIAVFTALQRRGIPSQLLHLPNENHWVLKPASYAFWQETILAWLARWLGPPVDSGSGRR
ncbi:MAG TPA: S9 family peptidase [Thermoanaerobaculia bacterium]|nr:S9 family peptidase [Thermoanaerobaculia bacterium]